LTGREENGRTSPKSHGNAGEILPPFVGLGGNKMKYGCTKDALAYIADKFGPEALLGRLYGYLPDFTNASVSGADKRLVYAVYENGAAAVLKNKLQASDAERETAKQKAVQMLNEAYITQPAAEKIIGEFTDALGWKIEKSAMQNSGRTERYTMNLFFVIGNSHNMKGEKIGTLNFAMEEVIAEIRANAEINTEAEIKIAVLQFSEEAKWVTPHPVKVRAFSWSHLEANVLSDLGAACKALNEKLTTKAFMDAPENSFAPIIFLFMDSEPTDDWMSALRRLKENRWFKCAFKVAFAIGEDANKEVLAEFTGSKELILTIRNPASITKLVRCRPVIEESCKSYTTVDEEEADRVYEWDADKW
jgi:uncharacterized protein YegL